MSDHATVRSPAKRIPGLHWWIAGSVITLYGALLYTYSVNIPTDDDYDNIIRFYFQLDHARAPRDLIQLFLAQHNENRLFFNRVVFLLERLLVGGTDMRRLIIIGNLGVLALFGLLVRGHRGSQVFPVAVVVTALFLFQPSGYESIFWAMDGLLRNYVLVFAALSFLLLEKGRLYSAACVACLSLFTQANGILVLGLGAAWILGQALQGNSPKARGTLREPQGERKWSLDFGRVSAHAEALEARGGTLQRPAKAARARRPLVSWVVISAGALAVYFYHYTPPPQVTPLAESMGHPLRTVEYFLAFVGSAVGFLGVNAAIAAGTATTCLGAYVTYRRYFTRQAALWAFMVFLFGSAALAALGRSGFGLEQAISSRYSIVSSCLFACVTVGALSLADTRKRWQVAAQLAVIVIALVHAGAAYAASVPTIKDRRDSLIAGAALFAHCRTTVGLHYNGNRLPFAQLLRYMEDRQYWVPPPAAHDPPWDEPCPRREGAALLPMAFSAHQYHGDKMALTGGSLGVHVRENVLHLEVRAAIPAEDPEAVIYIGVPVLPTTFSIAGLEADATQPAGAADLGLDITVGFPPDTDVAALADDMCVAFESTSLPLTLLNGNLPICEERLVLSGDG